MQLTRQRGGPTEEYAHVRVRMLLGDARKHAIPVRPAKVCRRAQRRDRVLVSADVVHDDVGHLVFLDLRRQVNVDLDPVLGILFLDRVQQ